MTTAPTPAPVWRRLLRRAAVAAGIAFGVLAGCTTLDEQQRKWIFQPSDRTWWGGLAAAEGMDDVYIDYDAGDGPVRLHGLWLPQPQAGAPVLLYLHGARWDVRGSAHRMRRMHDLGFSVLGIDYRGFGRSTAGLPSEAMAYEDAIAAWRWLADRHRDSRRYVFGHSLGGSIAVHLAHAVDDEAGLIVEGGFPSIPDVVTTFRFGWLPVSPLITQRFDAASLIGNVGAPVIVVHGSNDRLISPALGQALFDRASEPKRFVLVEGGSHHNANAVGLPQVRQAIDELFGLPTLR